MVVNRPNQCGSTLVRTINAPLHMVWSIVRRFDNPQAYKTFVRDCEIRLGDGCTTGSVRENMFISGFPASTTTERLEKLDDNAHVMIVSSIGGDDRFDNYRSVTSLHEVFEENKDVGKTVVEESYVVDVPLGNSEEETCFLADFIIRLDLKYLATVTEDMA